MYGNKRKHNVKASAMNTIIGTARKKNYSFAKKNYSIKLVWKVPTSIVNILSMRTNINSGKPSTNKVRYSLIYLLLMQRIKTCSTVVCVKATRITGWMNWLILSVK